MVYSYVNRPGSRHKYLELSVEEYGWKFHDFIALVPGSLRNIGKALQCNVQKGDFPHNFFSHFPTNYVGSIPPIDEARDFYGLEYKKSQEDIDELRTWHAEQCAKYCSCWNVDCVCEKQKWNAMQFLEEYCHLDVAVLADAAVKYRNLLLNLTGASDFDWAAKGLDPLHCLTQSQLANQIFLNGFHDDMPYIHVSKPRVRGDVDWRAIYWLMIEQEETSRHIDHIANNDRECFFFDCMKYFHGVCYSLKIAYYFHDCTRYGCQRCNREHENYEQSERDMINWHDILTDRGNPVRWNDLVIMRECEFENYLDVYGVNEYYRECANYCTDRDFFYGGRTEVFSPYASADMLQMDIKYHDVCSLYPTVCSFKTMPIGRPMIYFGDKCDLSRLQPNHENRYFGFAKIKVLCNRDDLLGLLPLKIDGKLTFDVRKKIGMWFTEEIYLAIENGYIVEEVYEVHHFEPSARSDTLMRGYMEFFLRMKQEAEGWKKLGATSDNPTEEEKELVCQQIYVSNGNIAKPRAECVTKNPTMRHVAKIFLNCLWGKFCQKQHMDFHLELSSYIDYYALAGHDNARKVKMSFRSMQHGKWRVHLKKSVDFTFKNQKYNIYIGAAVTAHARCYLHRQMLKIGPERILYCDTDSIVFLYPRDGEELAGTGLGQWTDEYPGKRIIEFTAIAPKCYIIKTENSESVKSKGIPMVMCNAPYLTLEKFRNLITDFAVEQNECELIQHEMYVKNFQIAPNTNDINYAYALPMTRYNQKVVRCVFSKRVLQCQFQEGSLGVEIARVSLLPIGHSALNHEVPDEYHRNYDQENADWDLNQEDVAELYED